MCRHLGVIERTYCKYESIPGATLFDLLASYDFSRVSPRAQGLTFNLDVSNLFNRTYISSCCSTIWCDPGIAVGQILRYLDAIARSL